MKTQIKAFNEEDAMIVVKVLIENGFTVKIYQTDDTIAETIVEFAKHEKGYNPYQE